MTGTLGMIMLDQTIVTVALPRMQHELHMTASGLQWIINAYILTLAATVAAGGKLGDIFGRYRAFQCGIVLFCGASAFCGLAPSGPILLAARAVQGVGAAIMQPASASMVINAFELHERGRAMAIYSGLAMAFMAVGPLLGGFFTEYFSWRLSFWVNVPVGIAVLFTSYRDGMKNIRSNEGKSIDWAGLALLIAGLVPLVLALQQGQSWGWTSLLTLGCLFGGLLSLGLFFLVERTQSNPLIQLKLFCSRPLTINTLVLFCISFAMIGQMVFSAIFMQNILGFSPFKTGLCMLPLIIPVAGMSQIMGRVFDRIGAKRPVCIGTILIAVGFVLQTLVLGHENYLLLVPGMIILGMGIGSVMTPANTDALNRAPAAYRGQASGLIQTFRQMGGTIGLAIAGGVAVTLLHLQLARWPYAALSTDQQQLLARILSTPADQQQQLARQLHMAAPTQAIDFVKEATAQAIAGAYLLSAAVAVLAFLLALFFLHHGAQELETESI